MPPKPGGSLISVPYASRSLLVASWQPQAVNIWQQLRSASSSKSASDKNAAAKSAAKAKKRKKDRIQFHRDPLSLGTFFPLCDAMRYIRAFEVGYSGVTCKYDLAINMKTNRSAPVVRGSIRLPNPVDTSQRVAVICPPDSDAAKEALNAGASIVGEENILDAVKEGKIDFERCLCHPDSYDKLKAANVARILGPKGIMPNPRSGTLLKDVGAGVQSFQGGTQFRERTGTVRLPIGRLNHTPEQLQANIRALMFIIQREVRRANEKLPKQIHDVVLSSPRSPGFLLSGTFMGEESLEPHELLET